jgi:hypothetical protein
MKILTTIGRVSAIFALLFVTLVIGTVVTSFLPSPPGRYIFTPANEIGAGALLLLVSWVISFWRWPRPIDLLLAWVICQVVIALLVGHFAGFSSIFLWWLLHISRFITPAIGLGMVLGLMTRQRMGNNGSGQQLMPGNPS